VFVYTRAPIRYIARARAPKGSGGANSAAKSKRSEALDGGDHDPYLSAVSTPRERVPTLRIRAPCGQFQRGNIHEVPSPA
jgi:hypothetical protein